MKHEPSNTKTDIHTGKGSAAASAAAAPAAPSFETMEVQNSKAQWHAETIFRDAVAQGLDAEECRQRAAKAFMEHFSSQEHADTAYAKNGWIKDPRDGKWKHPSQQRIERPAQSSSSANASVDLTGADGDTQTPDGSGGTEDAAPQLQIQVASATTDMTVSTVSTEATLAAATSAVTDVTDTETHTAATSADTRAPAPPAPPHSTDAHTEAPSATSAMEAASEPQTAVTAVGKATTDGAPAAPAIAPEANAQGTREQTATTDTDDAPTAATSADTHAPPHSTDAHTEAPPATPAMETAAEPQTAVREATADDAPAASTTALGADSDAQGTMEHMATTDDVPTVETLLSRITEDVHDMEEKVFDVLKLIEADPKFAAFWQTQEELYDGEAFGNPEGDPLEEIKEWCRFYVQSSDLSSLQAWWSFATGSTAPIAAVPQTNEHNVEDAVAVAQQGTPTCLGAEACQAADGTLEHASEATELPPTTSAGTLAGAPSPISHQATSHDHAKPESHEMPGDPMEASSAQAVLGRLAVAPVSHPTDLSGTAGDSPAMETAAEPQTAVREATTDESPVAESAAMGSPDQQTQQTQLKHLFAWAEPAIKLALRIAAVNAGDMRTAVMALSISTSFTGIDTPATALLMLVCGLSSLCGGHIPNPRYLFAIENDDECRQEHTMAFGNIKGLYTFIYIRHLSIYLSIIGLNTGDSPTSSSSGMPFWRHNAIRQTVISTGSRHISGRAETSRLITSSLPFSAPPPPPHTLPCPPKEMLKQ